MNGSPGMTSIANIANYRQSFQVYRQIISTIVDDKKNPLVLEDLPVPVQIL